MNTSGDKLFQNNLLSQAFQMQTRPSTNASLITFREVIEESKVKDDWSESLKSQEKVFENTDQKRSLRAKRNVDE